LEEKIDYMKQMLTREIEFRWEDVGIKFVRKFYPYYVNGFSGASKCRGELVLMDNKHEIIKLLNQIALQSCKNMLV
jgi:tRNA-dihydrouridine synthase